MDIKNILYAVATLSVMGVAFGCLLAFASKVFAVKVDERIPAIQDCLPGANCGGCGYPGCSGLATAIVEGRAPVNQCPVGGAETAAKIAAIMGVEADNSEKMVAHVHCDGGCNATKRFEYDGIEDCLGAMKVAGGPMECAFACIGLGTCEKACPFDAIHVIDGVAKVDEEKCTACQKCVVSCPKGLIDLVPQKNKVRVDCSSKAKGPVVMSACKVGCIGCKMCEKACKFDAIHVIDNVAVIDYSKCVGCKMCAKACPRHIIEGVPAEAVKKDA